MNREQSTIRFAAVAVCLLLAVVIIRFYGSGLSDRSVGAFDGSGTKALSTQSADFARVYPAHKSRQPPLPVQVVPTQNAVATASPPKSSKSMVTAKPNTDPVQPKVDTKTVTQPETKSLVVVQSANAASTTRSKPHKIQNRFFNPSSRKNVAAGVGGEEAEVTFSSDIGKVAVIEKTLEQPIGTTVRSGPFIGLAGAVDDGLPAQDRLPLLGSDLPEPVELSLMDDVDVNDRFAAIPPPQDKPRFKKFGAAISNSKEAAKEDDGPPKPKQPVILSASNRWKLAAGPGFGDRYKDDTPLLDNCSHFVEGAHGNFSPTPTMPGLPYDPCAEMNVYNAKTLNAHQRPILELGRPWYQLGPISEGSSLLGFHNHINWQYLMFGDFRSGIASNRQNGNTDSVWANQLNLFHHLKITSTERIVAGMTPLNGVQNTRYDFERDEMIFEGDADFDFAFIEADLGAITGGFIGETLPFDLPFAVGIMPLVFQNGVWFEDAILGAAVTIPARNSPRFDISNMDITFFAGYDKIDSPAFQGDDSAARVYGVASFIEALNGYFEIDYAFLDDRTGLDRSYHNFAAAYTRRFGRFLSNSTRIIVNAGQSSAAQDNTADGVLLISENSLITGSPSTVVPYLNMWAGFDRPQSVARAGIAGGILRNTGILFESDNLTGYPTLDATANDTFGMAMGLNLLADEFAQQLIVEMAMLGVMGDGTNRNAVGDQYGVGARYQLPLTNSVIFRADAMAGFLRGTDDINGVRMELRKKW